MLERTSKIEPIKIIPYSKRTSLEDFLHLEKEEIYRPSQGMVRISTRNSMVSTGFSNCAAIILINLSTNHSCLIHCDRSSLNELHKEEQFYLKKFYQVPGDKEGVVILAIKSVIAMCDLKRMEDNLRSKISKLHSTIYVDAGVKHFDVAYNIKNREILIDRYCANEINIYSPFTVIDQACFEKENFSLLEEEIDKAVLKKRAENNLANNLQELFKKRKFIEIKKIAEEFPDKSKLGKIVLERPSQTGGRILWKMFGFDRLWDTTDINNAEKYIDIVNFFYKFEETDNVNRAKDFIITYLKITNNILALKIDQLSENKYLLQVVSNSLTQARQISRKIDDSIILNRINISSKKFTDLLAKFEKSNKKWTDRWPFFNKNQQKDTFIADLYNKEKSKEKQLNLK